MSELADIVTAVRDLLADLQSGGQGVFATLRVHQAADHKSATTAIVRERMPAAYILFDGRSRADAEESAGASPTLSLLIAVENLRGGSAAIEGGSGHLGLFEIAEHVSAGLDGATVETHYRLSALDEKPLAADERGVVFEQRYRVDRLAELLAPTFGGTAIAGTESHVTVLLGPISVEAVAFGFPGIDGAYRHLTGVKGRTITWNGRLRAADDAAMNAIESDLETRTAQGRVATMTDAWGRSFAECVIESFERVGSRRRHAVTGRVVQGFELVFTQL